MGRVEELILQNGWRGMDKLAKHLPNDFCEAAAEAIRSWKRGTILLTTGFYVAGHAETDGPPGTLLLIRALEKLGFHPVMVTDEICRGYFEHEQIETVYLPVSADDEMCLQLLEQYDPVGLISVERCGKNNRGLYENARGVALNDVTAPTDRLFELTVLPTVGVGDGGNEIGMGALADVIASELSLTPCRVAADYLIPATVSNWGALGLSACLGYVPADDEFLYAYKLANKFGYVDGFIRENVLTEDNFPLDVGLQLLQQLRETIA